MGRVLAVFDDEELETAISGLQFAVNYVERRQGDIDTLQHTKALLTKMKRYRCGDTWPLLDVSVQEETALEDATNLHHINRDKF